MENAYENLDPVIFEIIKSVKECGEIMLGADRSTGRVDEKSGVGNFVTTYDTMIEKKLKEDLTRALPGSVFVGEEGDTAGDISKGYVFIVDPIDGTMNFIRNFNRSCISVGLLKDGEKYAGVVLNPYVNELFVAQKGHGAYLNGKKISVSQRPLSEGLIVFGTAPYYKELHKKSLKLAYKYYEMALDLRRAGAASADLCDVACGRAEFFFELRLSPWDFAAASLIVCEAGGIIRTMDGNEITFGAPCSVVAANSLQTLRDAEIKIK
ncbi:MAG: inositol monophosphatase [Clostridiales bacterium]|nr:inositol monophosphatase [Clostridiales bacterium]